MTQEIRTRIAPSPTGDWHLGTVRTALFAYLFARRHGGKFFLRIEDTDRNRYVPGSVERMLEVMSWLNLDTDPVDDKPYFLQSENLPRYQEVARGLVEAGKAYYCFATSEELQQMRDEQSAAKLPPKYDNRWGYRNMPLTEAEKRITAGDPYVIRQKMPTTGEVRFTDLVQGEVVFDLSLLDDHVLLKADSYPTYHLAHVVDDCDMKITHVVRAAEWLPSTPKHIALLQALEWPLPEYAHVPVILGPDKGKLGKRNGGKPVYEYRNEGYLPDPLINFLALLGWSSGTEQEIFTREELVQTFDLSRVHPSPAVFDPTRLNWFNAMYIRSLVSEPEGAAFGHADVSGLRTLLLEYWQETDNLWVHRRESSPEKFDRVIEAAYERLDTLAQFDGYAEVFYTAPESYTSVSLPAKGQDLASAKEVLASVLEVLDSIETWNYESLKTVLDEKVNTLGIKIGQLYLPVRYALTGVPFSPGALECLVILGKDESLARVQRALESVSSDAVGSDSLSSGGEG